MRRGIALVIVLLLLAGCGGTVVPLPTPTPAPTPEPTPDTSAVAAEEVAVYTVAIETYLGHRPAQLLLQEETSASIDSNVTETLSYVSERLPGLDPQTRDNLLARNDRAYPLSPAMPLPFPYILLTEAEVQSFFGPEAGGWDAFYARYPEAQGMMQLSRVGFNADMTQALIYVGNQSHWLAGAGYYYLLAKEGGTWKVVDQVMAWIS